MLGIERRKAILEKLAQEQKVHVSPLAQLFGVTEETIRRDLEKLEKKGFLRRSYGGAVLVERTGEELSFAKRTTTNGELKDRIGRAAASLVQKGDTIMMDSSTTGLALLRHIAGREGVTIITNSVRIVHDFSDSAFRLISTGGNLRAKSSCLTGSITCSSLAKYHVDLAVISCKAVDRGQGIMETNEEESLVKQTMIGQAKKCVLLVDHTKFDRMAFTTTCDFAPVDVLVTDMDPGEEWRAFLDKQQVELVVCGK